MKENVAPFTDTIGTTAGARSNFSGQNQTREYSDSEKPTKLGNVNRGERTQPQKWDEKPDRNATTL